MTAPKLVIVESPYKATHEQGLALNIKYAQLCLLDCLRTGEAPYASHLLYTLEHVLSDAIPEQRLKGIRAGFAWKRVADVTAFYLDLGMSEGMKSARELCEQLNLPHEFRYLPADLLQKLSL